MAQFVLLYENVLKWGVFCPTPGPGYLSRYSDPLRSGPSGDRIPVGGEIFPYPSRPALEPTQPPLNNGYRVFPRGKAAGAWC
jgi:hypothetical protein